MRLLITILLFVGLSVTATAADTLNDTPVAAIKTMEWKKFIPALKATNFETLSPEQAVAVVARAKQLSEDRDLKLETLTALQDALKDKAAALAKAVTDAAPGEEKRNYKAAAATLEKLNTDLGNVLTGSSDLKKAVEEAFGAGKAGLLTDLSVALGKNAQTDGIIQHLARELDQKLIGQYIKQKLEGFSASNEFCASVKNCADPKRDPRKPIEMKGLFNKEGTHDTTVPVPK